MGYGPLVDRVGPAADQDCFAQYTPAEPSTIGPRLPRKKAESRSAHRLAGPLPAAVRSPRGLRPALTHAILVERLGATHVNRYKSNVSLRATDGRSPSMVCHFPSRLARSWASSDPRAQKINDTQNADGSRHARLRHRVARWHRPAADPTGFRTRLGALIEAPAIYPMLSAFEHLAFIGADPAIV